MGEGSRSMGKLEKKHDHSLTDYLKAMIFAVVMLAPFFAVAVECLYMIFNKNAPTNYTGTPQDVFYNAITNITQQGIFNWTTTTGIYTPISAMTSGLDFGTASNTLSILLTYWALNTAIYIVFDLILFCFVRITHFLNGN